MHVEAGRLAELSEVEYSVRVALLAARRKNAVDVMYRRLADDYEIKVESMPAAVTEK